MNILTHHDQKRHTVRLYVPCEGTPNLLEHRYEVFTLRIWTLFGIPVWVARIDIEVRSINELIEKAFGS